MDKWLVYSQNRWAGWGYWLDYLAWFLAVWGLGVLLLLAVLRWFFPGGDPRWGRHTVLLALGAAVIAAGLGQLPELFHYRVRPYMAMPGVFDLLGGGPSSSFPSQHAVVAFGIAFVMGWGSWRWGLLCWPVALGLAWARVYAGVHYPSDILGALLVSFVCAWLLLVLREDLEPALDRVVGVIPGGRPIR